MWPGTADLGGWRSPQASAGTPKNTRESAQTDKKKPQLITVGASVLVVGADPGSITRSWEHANTRYGSAEGCGIVHVPTTIAFNSEILRILPIYLKVVTTHRSKMSGG